MEYDSIDFDSPKESPSVLSDASNSEEANANISLWEEGIDDEPIVGNEIVNLRRVDENELEEILNDNDIIPSFAEFENFSILPNSFECGSEHCFTLGRHLEEEKSPPEKLNLRTCLLRQVATECEAMFRLRSIVLLLDIKSIFSKSELQSKFIASCRYFNYGKYFSFFTRLLNDVQLQ